MSLCNKFQPTALNNKLESCIALGETFRRVTRGFRNSDTMFWWNLLFTWNTNEQNTEESDPSVFLKI